MKRFLFVACALFFLASCEKTIKLSVNNQPPKLVVDASIENDSFPVVVLSNSLNYFSTISKTELSNSFVHDAVITINDSSKTIQLKEYSITSDSGFTVYFYSIDPTSPQNILTGQFNKHYSLSITTTDGQTYTATTSIPIPAKTCDSIWWQPAPFAKDSNECVMVATFTDPPGLGNYVRYFTKRNSQPFYPGLTSSFDDQVVDGITYTLTFDMGWDKNSTLKPTTDNGYGYAYRGDTVTLKYCNIDKSTYDFWNTWDFAWQSYGNPFSAPVKVLGNISNGALGVFSGYATRYKTIIIPK